MDEQVVLVARGPPLGPSEPARRRSWLGRSVRLALALALAAGIAVLVLPLFGVPGMPNLLEPWLGKPEAHEEAAASISVRLVPGRPDTFELEPETARRMK